jgi:repressor LexA
MPLTPKQELLLRAIEESLRTRGFPPTVRELCKATGISSTSVVSYNLRKLEEQGYLERRREISRGIRLSRARQMQLEQRVIHVPVLGRIAAGAPLPVPDGQSMSTADETIALTRELLPEGDGVYALEVRGDSMIDALIYDGDIVVLKHQQHADNGDLVAVWLKEEKETTLKRIYREGERVRLQPANPMMSPIYVSASAIEIQGKVVLVIRRPARSARPAAATA